MQQPPPPSHTMDLRQPYTVKREPRNDQKWNPQQGAETFPKQMIYPRVHPAHKMMQQQQIQHMQQAQAQQAQVQAQQAQAHQAQAQQAQAQQAQAQQAQAQQFLHAQHPGIPPASAHGGAYKVPIFNFTSHDLGVYLYGKQDLRMVRIEPRGSESGKQPKDKGKPAKWCDMCQEIRFGECPKHGPLTSSPSHSTVPLNAPMSYAISTFPDEVGLCISGLPFAGYGVFARQTIPTGTWIGPYEGAKIPFEEGIKKMNKDTPFLWEICANGRVSHFLDASDENSSSWMRFIQCARFKDEQNLFVFQYCGTIYYRAFKDVPPGVELLVWYDEKYPHMFGLPLEINDMASCSVESIQTSGDLKQPQGDRMMGAPAMIAGSGNHSIDSAHPHNNVQGGELIRRDMVGKVLLPASSSSSATSSSFAFPRPAGMPRAAGPVHIASSGSFHSGPVPAPVHLRQRQDLPHPSMPQYGQAGGITVPLSMHHSSPSVAMSVAGPPANLSGMQQPMEESRLPNAPLPAQLIDKARASHEDPPIVAHSIDNKNESHLSPPMTAGETATIAQSSASGLPSGRLVLARPPGSSSSMASDGSNEERKTPDKAQQFHSDFATTSSFGPNSWPWTCNNCGKSFNHKSLLHNHACARSSPSGPFRCDRCPLVFNDINDAREHTETHRERSYKCRFCSRTFAGMTTLNNHMRTHSGERMFDNPRRLGNP